MLHIGHCSDALGSEFCRSYAMAIVELLDPTGKLFGPRIIAQVSLQKVQHAALVQLLPGESESGICRQLDSTPRSSGHPRTASAAFSAKHKAQELVPRPLSLSAIPIAPATQGSGDSKQAELAKRLKAGLEGREMVSIVVDDTSSVCVMVFLWVCVAEV